MMRSLVRSFRLVVGGVALLAVGGAALFTFVKTELDKKAVRDDYGAEVVAMCNPVTPGTSNMSNLPTLAAPLKAVVINKDKLYGWHDQLPAHLRAADKAQLGVVACVTERDVLVESCPYTKNGAEGETTMFTLNRVQVVVDVVLFNPTTGARIKEFSLEGGMPAQCPDEYFGKEDSVIRQPGAAVAYTAFQQQIEPVLFRTGQ